jgi:hypothetical protein
MATITITKHLYVGPKNIISIHNPNVLKWTFQPNDDTKDITSQVTISGIKFNGILTSISRPLSPDIYNYELDLTEILKYIYSVNFYHKQLPSVNNGIPSYSLIKKIQIGITGHENGNQSSILLNEPFLSHGVNQVGNPNASTMADIYDRKSSWFNYFEGYPGEIYWWTGITQTTQDLIVDGYRIQQEYFGTIFTPSLAGVKLDNFKEYLSKSGQHIISIQDTTTNLITGWTNSGLIGFASSGRNITLFSDPGISGHMCFSNLFSYDSEKKFVIDLTINLGSGTLPGCRIRYWRGGAIRSQQDLIIKNGSNKISVDPNDDDFAELVFFAIQGLSVYCSIQVNQIYTLNPQQELIVNTFDSCGEGLYIRYLSKEGFYRTWLFNKYYTIEQEQKKIGELTYQGSDMAARSYNMGYKDAYRSYIATSEGVRKDIRKQLMDLFTSPAVYLWNGNPGDADNEADWMLVDIEGSHQLIEKQEFANFTITIKLPELYTQTL